MAEQQERKISLESITSIISRIKDLIPTNLKDLNNDAGYITQEDAEEIFSGLDIDTSNLVTLDGVQTITGAKFFHGSVNFSEASAIIIPTEPSASNAPTSKQYVDAAVNTRVASSDVVTVPEANKILKLNDESKLPADITGAIVNTVSDGSVNNVIKTTLGTEDAFKVEVGSKDGSGYVDFRIGSNANESVYVTQYSTSAGEEANTRRAALLDSSGNTSFPGDLTATRVFNAVYNDYAEFFERGEDTQPGDIIALDETADSEKYIKATNMSKVIVGVQSAEYAHIIGGKNISDSSKYIEENLKEFIPVGLAGRVYVNVQGNVNVGDYIGPSEIPGIGKAYKRKTAKTVGIALTKNINNKCRILIR